MKFTKYVVILALFAYASFASEIFHKTSASLASSSSTDDASETKQDRLVFEDSNDKMMAYNDIVENVGTPFIWASENGHIEIVKILIENDADVNFADYRGFTPLTLASQNVHAETVELLIENDANVNAVYESGKTALNFASENGHIEIVKLLLEKGADANYVDRYGKTPLIWASKNGHTEIRNLLIKNGASVIKSFFIYSTDRLLTNLLEYITGIKKNDFEETDY